MDEVLGSASVRRATFTISVLLVISALAQVNLWSPYLRLSSVRVSYLLMLAVLSLPLLCFLWAFRLPSRTARIVCWLESGPLVLLSAWPLFWATVLTPVILLHGIDPSFERLHETSVGVYRVVVFRADHGGMSSFNISIRQEREILPGVLRVKHIGGASGAHDARVHVVDGRLVNVEFAWYPEGKLAWGRRESLELDGKL